MSLFSKLAASLRRRFSHRRRYARFRDWLTSLYDTLLRYFKNLPLPRRGRTARVHLRGVHQPLYLRLGSSDGFVIEEIFFMGVYDSVITRDIAPVRQIVDLGANAGFSVRLWRQHYPGAKLIAVEPDQGNFQICRLNSAPADGLVCLVRACVAKCEGTVYLDRSAEQCAFKMTEAATGEGIAAMSLPSILRQCGAEPVIDLLKCDIEGAEEQVFADCAGWLPSVRYISIELHPPYSRQRFLDDLRSNGGDFDILWTGETAGNELLLLHQRLASTPRDV